MIASDDRYVLFHQSNGATDVHVYRDEILIRQFPDDEGFTPPVGAEVKEWHLPF
jgi:hypothetical protein